MEIGRQEIGRQETWRQETWRPGDGSHEHSESGDGRQEERRQVDRFTDLRTDVYMLKWLTFLPEDGRGRLADLIWFGEADPVWFGVEECRLDETLVRAHLKRIDTCGQAE